MNDVLSERANSLINFHPDFSSSKAVTLLVSERILKDD